MNTFVINREIICALKTALRNGKTEAFLLDVLMTDTQPGLPLNEADAKEHMRIALAEIADEKAIEDSMFAQPETAQSEQPAEQSNPSGSVKADACGLGGAKAVRRDERFEQYRTFINTLFKPEDTICFVTIEHAKNRENERVSNTFVRVLDAVKPEYFAHLQVLNDTMSSVSGNSQPSVYIAMNSYPPSLIGGRVGRTQENVVNVRALYMDVDENGQATLEKIQESDSLPEPSIILESSPRKFQGMWAVDGISKQDAKQLLKAMAHDFDTDSSVAETARILRVPGLKNCKYPERPEVKVVKMTSARYSRVDFKLSVGAANTYEKKPEGWLDASFIEGNIDNQLIQFAGHYISAKNIKDPEELFTLLKAKIDKNGAFTRDGKTEFSVDLDRVMAICKEKTQIWPTGEEKRAKATIQISTPTATPVTAPPDQEWGDLIPIEDILLPVDKLDPMMLPAGVRDWFANVSYRMSVPLDFPAICGLTVLSGVLGRRVFVYPKAKDKSWHESIALSGAVISESGTIKTPVWKIFTNPITEIDADLNRKHKGDMDIYKAAKDQQKQQNKERKKKENCLPPLPEPEKPADRQRVIVNDVTPEKLQDILADNPCGVLYYRDELYGWVSELEKEGRELQRGIFLSAMTGDDVHAADRIGREGKTAVMCAAVFGSFQPELFRDFLAARRNVDDGTMARFPLLCWPDEVVQTELVDDIENPLLRAKFRGIARLFSRIKEKQVNLHFTPEAQAVFNNWLLDVIAQIRAEHDPGKRSHLSKYKGDLPKIAGLFQMIDLAIQTLSVSVPVQTVDLSTGETKTVPAEINFPSGQYLIDKARLEMAIQFLAYLEKHMHRCYDSVRKPYEKIVLKLAEEIKAGTLEDGFTGREISNRFYSHRHNNEIDYALEILTKKNWLRAQVVQQWTGRPSTRYEINPEARGLVNWQVRPAA